MWSQQQMNNWSWTWEVVSTITNFAWNNFSMLKIANMVMIRNYDFMSGHFSSYQRKLCIEMYRKISEIINLYFLRILPCSTKHMKEGTWPTSFNLLLFFVSTYLNSVISMFYYRQIMSFLVFHLRGMNARIYSYLSLSLYFLYKIF